MALPNFLCSRIEFDNTLVYRYRNISTTFHRLKEGDLVSRWTLGPIGFGSCKATAHGITWNTVFKFVEKS